MGVSELIVILMIVVLVFGASRLPQLGEGLGRAIKNFKKGVSSDDSIKVQPSEPTAGGDAEAQTEADEAEIVERKG